MVNKSAKDGLNGWASNDCPVLVLTVKLSEDGLLLSKMSVELILALYDCSLVLVIKLTGGVNLVLCVLKLAKLIVGTMISEPKEMVNPNSQKRDLVKIDLVLRISDSFYLIVQLNFCFESTIFKFLEYEGNFPWSELGFW